MVLSAMDLDILVFRRTLFSDPYWDFVKRNTTVHFHLSTWRRESDFHITALYFLVRWTKKKIICGLFSWSLTHSWVIIMKGNSCVPQPCRRRAQRFTVDQKQQFAESKSHPITSVYFLLRFRRPLTSRRHSLRRYTHSTRCPESGWLERLELVCYFEHW